MAAKPKRKGFFSRLRLPVAKEYVYPSSRNGLFLVGGVGMVLVFGLFAANAFLQQGALVSNGPLSSNHASFGGDCQACHTPFQAVTDEKCSVCHEKYGDEVGVHTFESHYLYRTADFTRVVPAADEPECFACHNEHVGRDAPITETADALCLQCHEFGSFNDGHPEFDAVADSLEEANLKFPHTVHVTQVSEREDLVDIEQACLYCHNADADGKNFGPISFEQHCEACHLTSDVATPWIPVASGESVGVLTLESLRSDGRPGSLWTYYTNPGEFQNRGATVRKTPVYHQDRWVVANLQRLRRLLYPSSGLADLIQASGDVDDREPRALYDEALATLRAYAEELRGEPDRTVQRELREIEDLVAVVEHRLRDPYAPLDETRFAVSRAERDTSLTTDDVRTIERVAAQLTQPCQQCHVVRDATIVRAKADQRTFLRAEFDHGAHITTTRCLDCHSAIPIRQFHAAGERPPAEQDRAAIQNMPSIETCVTCHDDGKAANTCVTCHLFHPDTSQRSNLLRYLD